QLGGDDGRARPVDGAYDNHALGAVLRSGVPRNAGAGLRGRSAGHGGATRTTSRSEGRGGTRIVPLFGRAGRSTSGRVPGAMSRLPRRSFVKRSKANSAARGLSRWTATQHRTVRELKADGWLPANTKLRSSKYLNNLIEQDHRGVKQRIAVMLG